MGKSYNIESAEKYGIITKYRLIPSTRFSLALAGFFGCVILYLMRINLSVAIVCMTIDDEGWGNATTELSHIQRNEFRRNLMWAYDENNWAARDLPYSDDTCPGEGGDGEDDQETGEFYWDRQLRGTINSSFFWGYVLTQLIGGMLAIRYGSKWVIGIGTLFLITASFLSPPAAHLSPYALMVMRFIKGLGSGVYFPCIHHIWAQWAPPEERSFLLTFVLSGNSWGSLVSFAFSGIICAELGWEWIFWIYALVGIMWFVFWVLFAYDPPEQHPRISDEELEYIKSSKSVEERDQNKEKMKTPWLKILTSPSVLCVYTVQFCSAWGGYTTLTSLPQYMVDVLKIDIKQNGLYNSLPHFCKFLMTIVMALIADALINKKILSIVHTRKLMQSLAYLVPAALLLMVGYLDCFSTGLIVTCLTFAEGFTAGTRAGALTNILDIAPRFAALLMGIGNTVANLSGIFAPIVAAALTPDGTQEQWRNVFFLSVGLYIFAWILFMIFAKGEILPWALPPDKVETEVTAMDATNKGSSTVDVFANGQINNAFAMKELEKN